MSDVAYGKLDSEATVVAVPERGGKCRIVTKHDARLLRPAHALRPWLFDALKRDPRVSTVLSGDHKGAVNAALEFPQPVDGWKILSSDLTSASDLLPLDLVEALVGGIIVGGRMPHWA